MFGVSRKEFEELQGRVDEHDRDQVRDASATTVQMKHVMDHISQLAKDVTKVANDNAKLKLELKNFQFMAKLLSEAGNDFRSTIEFLRSEVAKLGSAQTMHEEIILELIDDQQPNLDVFAGEPTMRECAEAEEEAMMQSFKNDDTVNEWVAAFTEELLKAADFDEAQMKAFVTEAVNQLLDAIE